ncbi:fumarylacetoacetate hydrolase family protein [Streptomyces aquilus]|uniref:fumarylacetoacetate hydrolase family protein n=1 Tax=Streptomyces aquilus TaxID=2548456 RepID=UPI0036C02853
MDTPLPKEPLGVHDELDELDNSSDLELSSTYDGESVQKGRTCDLIFGIPTLISYLSGVCEL